MGDKPISKVRKGNCTASVWLNKSDDGKKEFKSITVQKSYKDKEDKWQNTDSFFMNDVPKLILALVEVYNQSFEKEEKEQGKED